ERCAGVGVNFPLGVDVNLALVEPGRVTENATDLGQFHTARDVTANQIVKTPDTKFTSEIRGICHGRPESWPRVEQIAEVDEGHPGFLVRLTTVHDPQPQLVVARGLPDDAAGHLPRGERIPVYSQNPLDLLPGHTFLDQTAQNPAPKLLGNSVHRG